MLRGTGKQKLGAIANAVGYYAIGMPIGISLMFAAKMGVLGRCILHLAVGAWLGRSCWAKPCTLGKGSALGLESLPRVGGAEVHIDVFCSVLSLANGGEIRACSQHGTYPGSAPSHHLSGQLCSPGMMISPH